MKYIFHSDDLSYVIEDEKELNKFTRRSVLGCSIYIIALIIGGILLLLGMMYLFYLILEYPVDIFSWFLDLLMSIINFFGPPV